MPTRSLDRLAKNVLLFSQESMPMKTHFESSPQLLLCWMPIGASLLLALNTNVANAVDDRIIGTFDTDIAVADGSYGEWPAGSSSKTLDWANEDSEGNPDSGCLKVAISWTDTNPGWNDSKVVFHDPTGGDFAWPGIDCRLYVNLEWDVKVDVANSTLNPNGNYGGIQAVFQGWEGANGNPAGLGWVTIGNLITITNTDGWQHMKVPLTSYPYNLNKLVLNFVADGATNLITYLVDNVKLTAPPQPPPTLTVEKAVPGLAFVAASDGRWDRQNIRTIGSNYGWIGRPGPVSYSVEIVRHAPVDGFRLHMFLVPGISDPNRADSDWHETNILMVAIYSNPNGGAWASVHAKYNSPDDNGQQYTPVADGGGDFGGIWANNSAGTWTLTLSQDTEFVLTTPDGTSMTNTIPSAFIDVWRTIPELQFAVGVMPINPDYVGQKAIIKSVKITGTAGPDINADFINSPLDTTNTWTIAAVSPSYGVQQIPTDAAWWVNWTLPALGFRLQATPSLNPTAWASVQSSGFNAGNNHYSIVRQGDLPSPSSGYFRLIKEGYSKLLLLLPGETAAPGTPTGKTGSPVPQQLGVPFQFTVKAVDSEWFPVSGVDNTIRLTSTDESAVVNWGYLPFETPLVNGVFTPPTESSYFGTPGTWTIKVEDVTDPTKQSYTSAPVVVNP